MTLPNDNEVKEAIQLLEFGDENEVAYQKAKELAINFLQAYLKAGSQMPEKKLNDGLVDYPYDKGFNACREQATFVFMKSFEGFERTVAELREQIAKGEEALKSSEAVLNDIFSRHNGNSFHNQRVRSDIENALGAINKALYCSCEQPYYPYRLNEPPKDKLCGKCHREIKHALLAGKKGQNEKG